MSIGISEDHVELAASLRKWATGIGSTEAVRAAEQEPTADFAATWSAVTDMAIPVIGLPESLGGGGGEPVDVAVALEACGQGLVPGHLVGTTIAAALLGEVDEVARSIVDGARVALTLTPSLVVAGERLTGTVDVVWDAPGATWLLLGATDGAFETWFVAPAELVATTAHLSLDLTRRWASAEVDLPVEELVRVPGLSAELVRRTAVTFAAADGAGLARWCLATAVEHACVREQFGAKVGSFQAVKHLCAEMLETAESVTAVAWDVASCAPGDDGQWAFAADVAGAVAFDGAVKVAQGCIQVLGGIGFTFEHDVHLYLRRAVAWRNLLGRGDVFADALAARATEGVRREVHLDLPGEDDRFREDIRETAASIAAAPEAELRARLIDAGFFMPHWPRPHGLAASPVEQLVIDQELAAAGVTRPDIRIGGWAVPTILAHGSEEQKDLFVRPTLEGDVVWCQLFSEPGAGSDLASLRTRAVRDGDGWRLTGQKVWTSLAQQADWAICLARTDQDAPQHRGITYFLVDMTSPGIDVRPLREMTGDALFNEVFLEDVFVPDTMVVGETNAGWKLARTTLANERVAMSGTKLDVSVERAVELGGDPTRIGHAVALATVCSLLGTRATMRSLAGRGPGAESSVAKLLAVRSRQDASELVVDLLGDTAPASEDSAG
ncbi:MAG: acyl-CoA dehydrogenase family protein [Nocardioides sp.]|nr:acyl-CoA dehydrogenase family protein [Nocardioides sp.]